MATLVIFVDACILSVTLIIIIMCEVFCWLQKQDCNLCEASGTILSASEQVEFVFIYHVWGLVTFVVGVTLTYADYAPQPPSSSMLHRK